MDTPQLSDGGDHREEGDPHLASQETRQKVQADVSGPISSTAPESSKTNPEQQMAESYLGLKKKLERLSGNGNDSSSETGNSNDGVGSNSNSNSGTSRGYHADESCISSSDSYSLPLLWEKSSRNERIPQFFHPQKHTQRLFSQHSNYAKQQSTPTAHTAGLRGGSNTNRSLSINMSSPSTMNRRRPVKIDTKPTAFPAYGVTHHDTRGRQRCMPPAAEPSLGDANPAANFEVSVTQGKKDNTTSCDPVNSTQDSPVVDSTMAEGDDADGLTNAGAMSSTQAGNDSGGSGSGGTKTTGGSGSGGGSSSSVGLDAYINLLQACRPFFDDVYGHQAEQNLMESLKDPTMGSAPLYNPQMTNPAYSGNFGVETSRALSMNCNFAPMASVPYAVSDPLKTGRQSAPFEDMQCPASAPNAILKSLHTSTADACHNFGANQHLSRPVDTGAATTTAATQSKGISFKQTKSHSNSKLDQHDALRVCSVTQTNQEREHSHKIIQQHKKYQSRSGESSSETSRWGGSSSSLGEGKMNFAMLAKQALKVEGPACSNGKSPAVEPNLNKESNFTSTDSSSANSGHNAKLEGLYRGASMHTTHVQNPIMERKSRNIAYKSSSQESSNVTTVANRVTGSSSNAPSNNASAGSSSSNLCPQDAAATSILQQAPDAAEGGNFLHKYPMNTSAEVAHSNVSSLSSSHHDSDEELFIPDTETIHTQVAVRAYKRQRPGEGFKDSNPTEQSVSTKKERIGEVDHDSSRAIPQPGHSGSSRHSRKSSSVGRDENSGTLPGTLPMLDPGKAVTLEEVLTFTSVAR
jgi:hypothetical protein